MNAVEQRHTAGTVEVRTKGDQIRLGGYALKYNKLSQNLGGFVERIAPGTFDKTLADGLDVLARFQHDDLYLLGRTATGSLRLDNSDGVGLDYEVDMPDTDYARNLSALAGRGDVAHSSFAFRTLDDEWSVTDNGFPLRTLTQAVLVDVAPVVTPAYTDTSSGLRSLAAAVNLAEEELTEALRAGQVAGLLTKTATVIDLGAQVSAERSAEDPEGGQVDNHPRLAIARRRMALEGLRRTS